MSMRFADFFKISFKHAVYCRPFSVLLSHHPSFIYLWCIVILRIAKFVIEILNLGSSLTSKVQASASASKALALALVLRAVALALRVLVLGLGLGLEGRGLGLGLGLGLAILSLTTSLL
mgnify:CR=1 FL=1